MQRDTPTVTINLADAAKLLRVNRQTVRNLLHAGQIKGVKTDGKFGPQWMFDLNEIKRIARQRYKRTITPEEITAVLEPPEPEPTAEIPDSVRQLYERLLTLTEETTRYKALAEISESTRAEQEKHYQDELARLRYEAQAAQEKAAELAAEVERLKSRGFWARLFGGAG